MVNWKNGDRAVLRHQGGTMGKWYIPDPYWDVEGMIGPRNRNFPEGSFRWVSDRDEATFHVMSDMLEEVPGPW